MSSNPSKSETSQFTDQQKRPTNEKPPLGKNLFSLSRRAFLGVMTAIGFRLAVPSSAAAQTEPSGDTPANNAAEFSGPEREVFQVGDLQLFLNSEGFPISYIFADQEEVAFTQEQYEAFKAAQETAMTQGESEPAFQVLQPLKVTLEPATAENPYIVERPTDILSENELGYFGLKIVNSDDPSAIKFHLRESAVSESGPFEPIKLLNEGLPPEQKFELRIIVVKGSTINTRRFVDDPAYTEYSAYFDEITQKAQLFRQELSAEIDTEIDSYKNQLALNPNNLDASNNMQLSRFKQFMYENTLTDEDMLDQYLNLREGYAGQYFPSGDDVSVKKFDSNTGVLFITVPKMADTLPKKLFTVHYDKDGMLQIAQDYIEALRPVRGPRVTDNYIEPADINPNYNTLDFPEYRYFTELCAWSFYHEIMHVMTFDVFERLRLHNKLDQSVFYRFLRSQPKVATLMGSSGDMGENTPRRIFEGIAEEGAMACITRADQIKRETGSDKGYPFVWEIHEKGQEGYQISESRPRQILQSDQAA